MLPEVLGLVVFVSVEGVAWLGTRALTALDDVVDALPSEQCFGAEISHDYRPAAAAVSAA